MPRAPLQGSIFGELGMTYPSYYSPSIIEQTTKDTGPHSYTVCKCADLCLNCVRILHSKNYLKETEKNKKKN